MRVFEAFSFIAINAEDFIFQFCLSLIPFREDFIFQFCLILISFCVFISSSFAVDCDFRIECRLESADSDDYEFFLCSFEFVHCLLGTSIGLIVRFVMKFE